MQYDELKDYVDRAYEGIKVDMGGYFIYPNRDIWPECIAGYVQQPDDMYLIEPSSDESSSDVDDDSEDGGGNLELSQISRNGSDHGYDGGDLSNDDISILGSDARPLLPVSPYLDRSWNAWGTVSEENTMIGPRHRSAIQRLIISQRRMRPY
jgi:hypothetical protein